MQTHSLNSAPFHTHISFFPKILSMNVKKKTSFINLSNDDDVFFTDDSFEDAFNIDMRSVHNHITIETIRNSIQA